MAALAEDLMFGDFSDLDVEEYRALFRDSLQSSVEFPWDEKSLTKPEITQDGGYRSGHIPTEQGFYVQQQTPLPNNPPQDGVLAQQGVYAVGQGNAGPYYTYQNKTAQDPTANQGNYPNQWNISSGCASNVLVDSQDQSFDGAPGIDPQSEDGARKRRNKKRRDPDHYKKYLEGTSFDNNDGCAESMEVDVKDERYYGEVPAQPSLPASQLIDSVAIDMPPDPSYDYNMGGESIERTREYVRPAAAITNTENMRTVNYYDIERKVDVQPFVGQDVNQKFSQMEISAPAEEEIPQEFAAAEVPQSAIAEDAASTPTVPTIHISHSDSTASNEFDVSASGGASGVPTPEAEVASQPQVQAPPAPKVKSWASLFKGSTGGPSGGTADNNTAPIVVMTDSSPSNDRFPDDIVVTVPTNQDPRAKKLGEHLLKATPSHHPMNLQPRGLINTANWCYINSILQALLSCPPFYHIMKNLPLNNGVRKASSIPMLDAMYQFLQEFQELKGLSKRSSQDIRPGVPFEPLNIYQMLSVAQTSLAVKQGRQEDAEEFLSCLLNGLHDEMTSLIQTSMGEDNHPEDGNPNGLASMAVSNGNLDGVMDDENEWEQVGPRNKSSITRQAQFSSSPLSKIFGGIMRSALHQHGSKESATLQPFFSLQLDVQSQDIWTIQDALNCLGNKESVHGFMSNKTKKEVEAFRRISLEALPPVLILHLKRFIYDKSGGCQKLMKKVDYEIEIEINKDLISPNAKSRLMHNQRQYKLFAVVYHTGKEASGGHYITDVYHVGTSGWLRCDDSIVRPVKQTQVTKPQPSCIPYLFFYRRKDLLTKPIS